MKSTRNTILHFAIITACTANVAFGTYADVSVTFYEIASSPLLYAVADADPSVTYPSLAAFNSNFVLQPSISYSLLIHGRAQSQISLPGSSGYRTALDLSAVFGSGTSLPTTSDSYLDVEVRNVVGQPDEIHFQQFQTFPTSPFTQVFSASRTGATSRSFATGSYSGTISGQTLHLDGSLNAESFAYGEPGNPSQAGNYGYGSFHTSLTFSVTQPTSFSLIGSISAAGRGSTQDFPTLPNVGTGGFTNARSGDWLDPELASGYEFEMSGSSLFTDILAFPSGIDGDGQFEVWTGNTSLGIFSVGQAVDFGAGVANFRITGIDPAVDGTDPEAFPIQLAFNTSTADFTMTPINVPEPSTTVFGAIGILGMILRRFRNDRNG